MCRAMTMARFLNYGNQHAPKTVEYWRWNMVTDPIELGLALSVPQAMVAQV